MNDIEKNIIRFTECLQKTLDDAKALQILTLDVRGKTNIADFLIIACGTSNRHCSSVAEKLITLAEENNVKLLGKEGLQEGEWVLLDFGDVIVHIMQPQIRAMYHLEELWQDTEQQKQFIPQRL